MKIIITVLLFQFILQYQAFAQKYTDKYKIAQNEEKAGQYFEAFNSYRQAMLCTNVPTNNDALEQAERCYTQFRNNEKLIKKTTSFNFVSNVINNRAFAIKNNRYYLIDSTGNCVSDTSYENIFFTQSDVFIIRQNDLWGLIDVNGNILAPLGFDHIFENTYGDITLSASNFTFTDGSTAKISMKFAGNSKSFGNFAIAESNDSYGVLNLQTISRPRFQYSEMNWAGINEWLLVKKEANSLLIDTNENIIFDAGINEIYKYSNGFARVRKEKKNDKTCFGIINCKGELIIPIKYKSISDAVNGFFKVQRKNGKFEFIDTTGVRVASGFSEVNDFHDGIALVKKKNKAGYIDIYGNVIFPFKYTEALRFTDSIYIVKDEQYGLCNNNGRLILPTEFQEIDTLSDGLALYKHKNKFGYIDEKGEIKIEASYTKARPFYNNLAAVKEKGKWIYINTSGAKAFETTFKDASDFSCGVAIVRTIQGFGAINTVGDYLLKDHYREISFNSIDSTFTATDTLGSKMIYSLNGNLIKRYFVGDEELSSHKKQVLEIANDTFIPAFLLDTLFLLGNHLVTYEEFINSDLETMRSWTDSTTFFSVLNFAACSEHNRTRERYFESNKTSHNKMTYTPLLVLFTDSLLCNAAQKHSNNMFQYDFFNHYDQNGNSPFDRIKNEGAIYGSAGENICAGYHSLRKAIIGWIYSEGHFKNMTDRSYRQIGIGYCNGYFTANFTN
ncbi:MAG: WG repeat-containing protein [Bacteroidales bacterium]|nr:WG repeat-containing protein [Bacteroidales bacterium]